jgi:hypothetical protein
MACIVVLGPGQPLRCRFCMREQVDVALCRQVYGGHEVLGKCRVTWLKKRKEIRAVCVCVAVPTEEECMAARDSPALQSLVSHVRVPRSAYRRVVVHNRVLTGLVFCQSVKVNVHGFRPRNNGLAFAAHIAATWLTGISWATCRVSVNCQRDERPTLTSDVSAVDLPSP